MKKVGLVVLAVLAVLIIVATAGCVTQPTTPPTQQQGTSSDSGLAIVIHKTGVTYNIGDTMDVILPSNPSTGYTWSVKSSDAGISVTETASLDIKGLVGTSSGAKFGSASYQSFSVKAESEGDHSFTLVYKRAGDAAGIYEYTDILHVKKTNESVMEHRGVFFFSGDKYTVTKGTPVTISVGGNPTTGYQWFAQPTEGLKISEPVYKQNDAADGMVGVPGVYTWTITADNPGAYTFTALYQRSWETGAEPASRIIVPVCFTVE